MNSQLVMTNEFNLSAAAHLRRSPVSSKSYASPKGGIQMANATLYSRIGFRGKGSIAFLQKQNLDVPEKPNQALFNNGLAVLRLSNTEIWVIDTDGKQGGVISELETASTQAEDTFKLFCQHSQALLIFSSEQRDLLATMFAKVCGVDLRESAFPSGSIAQTSVARVNGIVVKQQSENSEVFYLLSDCASAEYLWSALEDAAGEY